MRKRGVREGKQKGKRKRKEVREETDVRSKEEGQKRRTQEENRDWRTNGR